MKKQLIEKMSRERFALLRAKMFELRVCELIDLLAAEDLQTRFLAEMCLRDKAGV